MSIGLMNGGLMGWTIPCQTGVCDRVTGVEVVWGTVAANTPAQIIVQDDPNNDGDPGDAVTLICVDVLTEQEGTGIPVLYPIPTTPVNGGYFVTVTCDHQAGEFPAGLDTTDSQGTSWLVSGCPDPCEPYCGSANYDLIDTFTPGNWMVTVHSTESPFVDKYVQPVNCDGTGYWSNTNSDQHPWKRFDNFVCQQTGNIMRIDFWGGMYDSVPVDPRQNLQAIQIDLYEFQSGGPCGYLPGPLLHSYTIPADALLVRFDCHSNIPHFRYTAYLPGPCMQQEGEQYVLMIAGVLMEPDGAAFYWSESTFEGILWGASWDEDIDTWDCDDEQNNSFGMYTDLTHKFEQSPDCTSDVYLSNVNSDLEPWVRFDDFVCQQTGDIYRVEFWGNGFDIELLETCGLSNIESFRITFSKWQNGGECDWQPGELLRSYMVPAHHVSWELACTGPDGYYLKFTVDLPDPFYQEEGEHYVLSIAGVLSDPDEPCVFGWLSTSDANWSDAASYEILDEYWSCGGPDESFAFYTMEMEEDCPADVTGDGVVDIDDLFQVLSAWGVCDACPEDINEDGVVDIDDVFEILASWGPCP